MVKNTKFISLILAAGIDYVQSLEYGVIIKTDGTGNLDGFSIAIQTDLDRNKNCTIPAFRSTCEIGDISIYRSYTEVEKYVDEAYAAEDVDPKLKAAPVFKFQRSGKEMSSYPICKTVLKDGSRNILYVFDYTTVDI